MELSVRFARHFTFTYWHTMAKYTENNPCVLRHFVVSNLT